MNHHEGVIMDHPEKPAYVSDGETVMTLRQKCCETMLSFSGIEEDEEESSRRLGCNSTEEVIHWPNQNDISHICLYLCMYV
jgi:hypothetical protein